MEADFLLVMKESHKQAIAHPVPVLIVSSFLVPVLQGQAVGMSAWKVMLD